IAQLPHSPCKTVDTPIHGASVPQGDDHWDVYGSDASKIKALAQSIPELENKLHPSHVHLAAQVVWAIRHEMARTIEDVLARRIRMLFLDARAAMEMAPYVAQLMAHELEKDEAWISEQLIQFTKLAKEYLGHPA